MNRDQGCIKELYQVFHEIVGQRPWWLHPLLGEGDSCRLYRSYPDGKKTISPGIEYPYGEAPIVPAAAAVISEPIVAPT